MGDTAVRRFEFAAVGMVDKPLYAGETELSFGIDEDDPRWSIWKYTWDGDGNLASIEELHGPWSERDSLPWTL